MQAFIEAQHAAELAVLAMCARAVLARATAEEPDVVAVVIACAASTLEVELQNRDGLAVGGYAL